MHKTAGIIPTCHWKIKWYDLNCCQLLGSLFTFTSTWLEFLATLATSVYTIFIFSVSEQYSSLLASFLVSIVWSAR